MALTALAQTDAALRLSILLAYHAFEVFAYIGFECLQVDTDVFVDYLGIGKDMAVAVFEKGIVVATHAVTATGVEADITFLGIVPHIHILHPAGTGHADKQMRQPINRRGRLSRVR